jgi:hypothetical protein
MSTYVAKSTVMFLFMRKTDFYYNHSPAGYFIVVQDKIQIKGKNL